MIGQNGIVLLNHTIIGVLSWFVCSASPRSFMNLHSSKILTIQQGLLFYYKEYSNPIGREQGHKLVYGLVP